MSSDLNNSFEKLVRNKLEDYTTPVEPSSWGAIEKSLIRRQRSKYLYVTTGIVAAAVALLLITLNLPDNVNQQDNKEKETVQKTTPPPNPQILENQTKTEQEQPVSNSPAPVHSATVNTIVAQVEEPDTETGTDTDADTNTDADVEDPPVKERLNIVPHTISGVPVSLSTSNKLQLPDNRRIPKTLDSKPTDKKDNNRMPDNKNDDMTTAYLDKTGLKKADNKKWSVIMGFGAGNYQAPVNNRNADLIMSAPLLTSAKSENYVKNKYKDEINVPDNAGSQHGLPLSAKFIVRKDFNSRWAIESGLSYTYLSTKYRWNKNTVNQQLHYLGIPLNAVCYIVSKPKWDVYASAGGMVEKGVYAYIDRSDNIATKANMKGLQWSVNGAIGATYKLHKGVGLFFEPQIGYFFDNGQPESIRTTGSASFGLGVGLRFNF